ncbi:zinc finger protein 292 [Ambystoma mexicanum]|uniref:zinc finger protein 292 n=1 Tax=Ambystoma mexicanum TaxID=8296 RepID=UPI0037E94A4D
MLLSATVSHVTRSPTTQSPVPASPPFPGRGIVLARDPLKRAYATERGVKMADEEAEKESGCGRPGRPPGLGERLQELEEALRQSDEPAEQAASEYCQRFCQTLLEYAEKWKSSEDHLPLLEVYTDAIQSYSKARLYLTADCENVPVVLERLALSCVELLLGLPNNLPDKNWKGFQAAVWGAHQRLLENGNSELLLLYRLSQEKGVWKNPVLHSILHEEPVGQDEVNTFLALEAPILLEMRIKHLLKASQITQATVLAKLCSDHQDLRAKGNFKQMYLVCLCSQSPNIKLIEEISKMDCKDALEMICNLESEGDEKTALIICAAFLSRQLQLGDMDCAWELTLFWSKLQQRVDPSVQVYLERCRQLALLTKTVYHIFFLIKIIQSETEGAGLSTCIELCVKALRLESGENANVKISICKTISCLLPDDLEVKRACQLSEFLLEPTVDAYYAVEMLYNQPDQKYDEDSLPVPNSLRCELLLVLKTRWPFDPEFWDWKTLKRQCLALMGEEASIVSSIDELNDSEVYEKLEDSFEESKGSSVNGISNSYISSGALRETQDDKRKKKDVKKLRDKGFVSTRFRNFQAYMQYCVLCDKEFLGHRIIRHAQKHHTDGIYSCPICAKKFDSKERLVPHVSVHVKQSSKERLDEMKPLRRLRKTNLLINCDEQNAEIKPEQRSLKKSNIYSEDFVVFDENDGSDEENGVQNNPDETHDIFQKLSKDPEFTCPVLVCKKGFKHHKNLIAHVKAHKDNEEAVNFLEMQSKKVICHYCRRHFVSVAHLNDHLQMHCGSNPYMCIQLKCRASFQTNAQLLAHRKEHLEFRAQCMFPKCGRIFSESSTLYEHEAKHYHTFTCMHKSCGKVYHSQIQLESHLSSHELKHENALKDQKDTSAIFNKTLTETNSAKNVSMKSELTYNPNCISNSTDETKPIKIEGLEPAQACISHIQHTALGTCGQALVSSKDPEKSCNSPSGLGNVVAQQTAVSELMLGQSSVEKLEKGEAAVASSHIKKSPLSQGICDIILTQGKLAAAVNMIDTGNTLLSQIYTAVKDACNDSSLPIFHESKEIDLFNQSQQDLNASVHCGTSKLDLAVQSVERQMGTVVHLGPDNEALYESSFVFPEFEDRVKAAANLLSKTSNGSLFVSAQSSLTNPLTSSVLKQLPLQKFTCLIEGCTRVYNSIQSIGKHMKAAHPAQYPAFTQERKRRKRQRSRNSANNAKLLLNLSPKAGGPSSAVSSPNKTNNINSFSSDLQSIQTPVFPSHLENLVNPMIPSLEMNQAARSHRNAGAFLSTHLEDLAKAALPLKFENNSDPFLPLPAEDCSISNFSSLTLTGPNPVFSHIVNTGNHELLSQNEAAADLSFPKQEYSGAASCQFNFNESSQLSTETKKEVHGQSANAKERIRTSRAKCPAIIRDGKFICRRCFRVFSNPSSLGGHLSKRAICKPIGEDSELSEERLESSGQASLLASIILASNLQSSQQSTFTPEPCFKDPSYLQTLAVDSQSSVFLQSLMNQVNAANLNANIHDERNEIVKQALEAAGVGGTFESNEILQQFMSPNCVLNSSTVSTMGLPCASMSSVLESTCHPDMLMMDKAKTLNFKSEENSGPMFTTDLLKNSDSGVCSIPVIAPQCVPSNSCRVSVISGPLSTISSQMDPKEGESSKKKEKAASTLETIQSQNLTASDLLTAMGNIAKNFKENIQKPVYHLQQNSISNSDPHLFKSMSDKLNGADNQMCSVGINDFQQNPQAPALQLQSFKEVKENWSKDVEGTVDVSKINTNLNNVTMDKLELTSNIPNIIPNTEQQNCLVNCAADLSSENGVPKTLSPHNDLPGDTAEGGFTNSSSAPEMTQMEDENIVNILEQLQRLKLENDLSINGFESDSTSTSPPSDICSPLSAKSFLASKSSAQVPETDLDKIAKPFVCREQTCHYRAMTKDALFKHYRRYHKYTDDILTDLKKNQLKFSPFRCVIPDCTKTFTRNSNLRAHCHSVHHFSSEEMEKLRIKRPFEVSLNEGLITPPRGDESKRRHVTIDLENNIETPSRFIEPAMKNEAVMNPHKHISIEQECRLGVEIGKEENLPTLSSLMQEKRKKVALRKKVQELNALQIRQQLKEKEEKNQKGLDSDGTLPAKYNPYRPYRCVHQDCFAAFTIQQNLILHYQAVHSSDLPTFGSHLEEESETYKDHDESESAKVGNEFRCQEYDCSRIFKEVASLIQHYMKLHEMIPEEIEQVMLGTNIGKFKCDQPKCVSSFTMCSSYLTHLEVHHGIKVKQCREDGIYKCDCEGCDRIYATRSNLFRHIYHKHNERHKAYLMRPRRNLQDDEENHSNKANEDMSMRYKPRELKYDASDNEQMRMKSLPSESKISKVNKNTPMSPLQYGKKFLFLKTKSDALVECSDAQHKQYPCMLRGCTSIVASERSIIRHYQCHKITMPFALKNRAALIVCKKKQMSRVKPASSDEEGYCGKRRQIKESDASSESSDESIASASQLSEPEKDEVDELAELLNTKLLNDDNDAVEDEARKSSINKKAGVIIDPVRKVSNNILKRVHRQKKVSLTKKRKIETSEAKLENVMSGVNSGKEAITVEPAVEPPPSIDLSSFKPMGFEVSFLKFLEESAVKQKTKRHHNTTEIKTDMDLKNANEKPSNGEEASSEEEASSGEEAADFVLTARGEVACCKQVAGSGKTGFYEASREETNCEITSFIDSHTCPIVYCENLIQFANPCQIQCIRNVQFVLDETLKGCTELAFKQLQKMKPSVVLKKVVAHFEDDVISEHGCCCIGENVSITN